MLTLLLLGGTAAAQTPEHVLIHGHVFGGGNEGDVSKSVTVNISGNPHIKKDVYGGGALANVGWEESDTAYVNINGGTIDSNVYGGGLGQITPSARAALVYGGVHVNIGNKDQTENNVVIGGAVYGCNNLLGSPQSDVFIDIWKTAHILGDNDSAETSPNFAIDAVYGGGNQAHFPYDPENEGVIATTTVRVHDCDNTIRDLFGGGNAADVYGTIVQINGGKFDRIFAGGNGAGNDNPGANIGGGGTTLQVHAGLIRQLFGGSNEKGTIEGPASVIVDHPNTACTKEDIEEFYGGGNMASITGDLNTVIECGVGLIENLYGGANQANVTGNVTLTVKGGTINNVFGGNNRTGTITGNVTLNLYGGTITNAFGGNNAGGNITGFITVNVDSNRTDCPLTVDYVYGGGKNASYTPSLSTRVSPVVNIIRGTVQYDVFGGGLGTTATATSYPKVVMGENINYSPIVKNNIYGGGSQAQVIGNPSVLMQQGEVRGNIFAAGKGIDNTSMLTIAKITGNTTLTVRGGTVKNNIYGGGELASVIGNTTVTVENGTIGVGSGDIGHVFGAGLGKPGSRYKDYTNTTNSNVFIKGGNIKGSIFGGSENGHVTSNTSVVVSGGTIGTALTEAEKTSGTAVLHGNVYGGGRGIANPTTNSAGRVSGNSSVTVRGGTIYHNIYGGGSMASVGNTTVSGGVVTSRTNGHADVYIYGGQIGSDGNENGHVFGSSRGIATSSSTTAAYAFVNTTHVVIDSMAYVRGSVFGSGENGHVGDTTYVEIKQSYSSPAVEAGYPIIGYPLTEAEHQQNSEGVGPTVLHGNVYGGGRGIDWASEGVHSLTAGRVYGSTRVKMNGGHVRHNVYGGGSLASVAKGAFVTISGGNVGDNGVNEGHVYGSGRGVAAASNSQYANMAFVDSSVVIIEGNNTYIHGAVFGGGANGHVQKNTHVYIRGGHIGDTLTAAEHQIDPATGISNVQVFHGNVYGGGRGVDHQIDNDSELSTTAGRVYGNTEVVMTSGTVLHSIYGGGSMASVGTFDNELGTITSGGSARVVIKGGWVGSDPTRSKDTDGKNSGRVFGSGRGMAGSKYANMAYVNASRVIISDSAYVHGSVFGSGENGHVLDSTFVQVTGGIVGIWDTASTGHIYTGNVYGGGRGVDHDNSSKISRTAGWVHKSTRVEISGGYIRHNVYGGGSLATVGDTSRTGYLSNSGNVGRATVKVTGGRIGINGHNNGNVFGSGLGRAGSDAAGDYTGLTYVANTFVTVNYSGTASTSLSDVNVRDTVNYPNRIAGSVFGAGENGHVHRNTSVKIQNGIIGTVGTYIEGNVFGGGLGSDLDALGNYSLTAGKTYGNTGVDITGGRILHSVYGGGNMASVGSFDNAGNESYGDATVNISGGIIGVDGYNNGHVFGSCRGMAAAANSQVRKMAFVNNTYVTISGANTHVCGSVYGGGENGHTHGNATVNISNGTIGMPYTNYDALSATEKNDKFPFRGNVYGAGCGTDYVDANNNYSDSAGIVLGNTNVSISGGLVCRNVYGGGAMASVGTVTNRTTNANLLSYPMVLTYKAGTGTATVNITGGRIGIDGKHNGDVFGSCRGEAGERNKFAPLANVRETHVTVNYPSTAAYGSVTNTSPYTACIAGSVYGSGENGHTYGDTYVTIQKGLIGINPASDTNGSVFGGGSGMGLMDTRLVRNINGPGDTTFFDTVTYSVTSGKVYGNTNVTISGGHILHNVYGGGNLGSIGKGNYHGYGETCTDTLNSGHAYVNIYGGTIGTDDNNDNGHIFGSGHGITPRDETRTPRILYCPEFFCAYTNRTYVTIGETVGAGSNPRIYGSVFGGGENGHTRYNTHVVVNKGEIGRTYGNDANAPLRGNVYGAGRGIDKYNNEYYNASSGSVTHNTLVDINGGTIHRNVYGGGSLASVGAPAGEITKEESLCQVNINSTVGYATDVTGHQYGGSVYGSSRGLSATDGSNSNLAKCAFTEVNINSGGRVLGSVFGGGENGQVGYDSEVNLLSGGNVGHSIYGGGQGSFVTGSVDDQYAGQILGNTTVNLSGGTVTEDVYGGCRSSFVHGNTHVYVGNDKQVGNDLVINGNVFGANNLDGNVLGNTYVDVYYTAHGSTPATNKYPTGITNSDDLRANAAVQTYAIKAVYGGGNLAKHMPTAANGTTQVYIHYCEENTIGDVYGGCNAADSKNTHVIIDGGRIHRVFGGGNGEGEGNPGANVINNGITDVHGGLIDQVFGGSNTLGTVGNMVLNIDDLRADGETPCDELVGDIFNGGNQAPIFGNGELTIACGAGKLGDVYGGANEAPIGDAEHTDNNLVLNIEGGEMERVFGGSNNADIWGNVTVNIHGGSIDTLFGGNNSGGAIKGKISVNVNFGNDGANTCADPRKLDVIFGGGKDAPYAPTLANALAPNFSPEVRILNDIYTHQVFGGGKGSTARVTGHPLVLLDGSGANHTVTIIKNPTPASRFNPEGDVYGGGDAAPVGQHSPLNECNPMVKVIDATVNGTVYGGGYGSTAVVYGNPAVAILGLSRIDGNVYGGGNAGIVYGSTDLQIGYGPLTAAPEVVHNATTGKFGIYSTTPATTIYYTTDGTTPTTSSNVYTDSITSSSGKNIQAIAIRPGYMNSEVGNLRAPTPTITETSGNFTLSSSLAGASYYYTLDGSDPTTSSTSYSGAFSASEGQVVKAITFKDGHTPSYVASLTVKNPKVEVYSDSVLIAVPTGSTVYYSLDGSNPSTAYNPAGEQLKVTNANQTVKVVAKKNGYNTSEVVTVNATTDPVIFFGDDGTLYIECPDEPDDLITYYYTTNGSDPTTSSTVFNPENNVRVAEGTTVNVIAKHWGKPVSEIISATR